MNLDTKKVRRLMAAKGYNIVGFARVAKVSPSTVTRLIKHGTTVRTDTLGKLARALEVDIFDILAE